MESAARLSRYTGRSVVGQESKQRADILLDRGELNFVTSETATSDFGIDSVPATRPVIAAIRFGGRPDDCARFMARAEITSTRSRADALIN